MCREDDRELGMRETAFGVGVVKGEAERFTHSALLAHTTDECLVHLPASLVGHAEASVAQTGGDVFGGAAETRDFKVVNRRRTIHRDVSDLATAHEIDEERRQSGLDDVSAEHDDDAAL